MIRARIHENIYGLDLVEAEAYTMSAWDAERVTAAEPQQALESAARAVVRKRNSAEGNERQEREN